MDVICVFQSSCTKSSYFIAEKLQKNNECGSVCKTKECIELSNHILSTMDQSADPCSDFYHFACGKFRDRYEGYGNRSVLTGITGSLYNTIRDVVESSIVPEGSSMHKVKIVYDSCMNIASSELNVVQDLLNFLRDIGIPNWPHLQADFSFENSFTEIIGKLNTYKVDVFLLFTFYGENNGTSEEPLLDLTFKPARSIFNLRWQERSKEEVQKAVVTILHYLGLDWESSHKMCEDFIEIENKVKEILDSEDNCTNPYDDEIFKCDEENEGNVVMVCKVLESVVRNGNLASRYHSNQLKQDCSNMYYINEVFSFIRNQSDWNIANYIAIRIFIKNIQYLNFSLRRKLESFVRPEDHDDYSAALDQWKRCIHWIAHNMQFALGAMYVQKLWPNKTSDRANDLVQEFINMTTDILLQQTWIDDSKEQIAEDMTNIKNTLHSAMEFMKNETKVNTMYEKFNPSRSSFLQNIISLQKNDFTQSLLSNKLKFLFSHYGFFAVNAYGGDDVYLTFGILSYPIFGHGYPNLFNIAKVGHIIGHEIGHHIYFFLDRNGNVHNKTRENFKGKAQCLIDQYSRFELKKIGKNLKGNQTVAEDFPDNMSLKVLEKLSEKYLRQMKDSGFSLPGTSYSPEEIMYIAYTQTWCSVRDAKKEELFDTVDPHSPPEIRMMATLQNSHMFSEVFKCPKTSDMNLREKCLIFE